MCRTKKPPNFGGLFVSGDQVLEPEARARGDRKDFLTSPAESLDLDATGGGHRNNSEK